MDKYKIELKKNISLATVPTRTDNACRDPLIC